MKQFLGKRIKGARIARGLLWGGCAALPLAAAAQPGDAQVSEMLDVQSQTTRASQQAQEQIDALADETQELLSEYRLKLQELDRLRRYNANLERTIADQEREQASLEDQITGFGDLERGIVPLMLDMIDALEQFVRLDVPFQLQERQGRLQRLRELMDRADVSVSEKYRQIMDAYLIETAFGRTIEAYSGQIDTDAGPRKVEFFRLGRTLLAYQSPDRQIAGYWDAAAGDWRSLPDAHRASVSLGLSIAKKQAAPEILVLPVAAPRRATP